MEYRQLGKTGFSVGVIGLGVEHLTRVSVEDITTILRSALKQGVNYIDLVWSFPNIIEGVSEALVRERAEPVIAFHLGSCVSNGKYKRSRNPAVCEKHLFETLDLMNLDYAPIANIHYIDNLEVWKKINQKGILTLAKKLKDDGVAKAISVSTHDPQVIKLAAESGLDSIMHQVNIASHMYSARNEALQTCSRMGVGVAAMKPFAAGELLKAGKTAKIASYKTGWKTITMKVPEEANPTKLLNYTLSQPGVCTAVTGISSSDELSSNLEYLQSSNDEKDYQHILATIEMENA